MIARWLCEDGVRFFIDDIGQAFVSTSQVRKVYVNHPPGYEIFENKDGNIDFRENTPGKPGYKRMSTVMPLQLNLYGGLEAGRIFYDVYRDWHLTNGFTESHYDQCYFEKTWPNGDFIRKNIHVDDGIGCYKGEDKYEWYRIELSKRFKFTCAPLTKHLGVKIDIDYDRKTAKFSQEDHILKLLARFGMSDCTPRKSPTPSYVPSEKDIPTDPHELRMLRASFDMRSFVGDLNFLQQTTRPELSFNLKILSSRCESFGEAHIHFAKHTMKWLKHSAAQPLVFRCSFRRDIQIFTDASHAGCVDTRRSISAVVIKYGGNTVLWGCHWQTIVSHSSTESELMALDKGATLGQYIKYLVGMVAGDYNPVIDVFIDNQSTIQIGSNPIQPKRNLHIHARYFYIRDLVMGGDYSLHYCPTAIQVADLLCTYKGTLNFQNLYALLVGCACVQTDTSGNLVWKKSLL